MDLVTFWDSIKFSPLHKEKSYWVLGATVDSGIAVQLRVVSRNNTPYLRDMDWKLIFGTDQKDKERIQYFSPSVSNNPVLSIVSENLMEIVYRHRWEKYIITKKLNPNIIDMNVSDDEIRLVEVISSPSFTIKKIA